MKTRVYLAGPMRGYPQFNFPAFDSAKRELTRMGYIVTSPADMDRDYGFDGTDSSLVDDEFVQSAMARDIAAIIQVDELVLLPGWEASKGTAVEITVAQALGKRVLEFDPTKVFLQEIHPNEVVTRQVTFTATAKEPYGPTALVSAIPPPAEAVDHPQHYNSHPSGIECIEVVEHMTFNIGNVIKYLWRSGLKEGTPQTQDLKKASWYLTREIEKLEGHGV